jgi:hypothetical protein
MYIKLPNTTRPHQLRLPITNMSMNWADVCCSSTSQPFETPPAHFDGKNNLQQSRALWNSHCQADLLFQDIVGHRSTDPEYDIYLQLTCAQIARNESRFEALATVFDAMSSTANRLSPHNTTHLVEPTSDVLNMFAPTDLCNYSDPKVSHQKPKTPTKPKCYGVDQYALSFARDYMIQHGYHARTITRRVILEHHIAVWTRTIADNSTPIPHTRKILFAIAHGLKLVHVRRGSTLEWNKFRDNFGNKIN